MAAMKRRSKTETKTETYGRPVSPEAMLALTRGRRRPWVTLAAMRRNPAAFLRAYLGELRLVLEGLGGLIAAEVRAERGGLAAIVVELRPAGRVLYASRRTREELAGEVSRAFDNETLRIEPPAELQDRPKTGPRQARRRSKPRRKKGRRR